MRAKRRADPTDTKKDLPKHRRQERHRRAAALDAMLRGEKSDVFVLHAECASCGATVKGWRERLDGTSPVQVMDEGDSVVRIAYAKACGVCDGYRVVIRAERRAR